MTTPLLFKPFITWYSAQIQTKARLVIIVVQDRSISTLQEHHVIAVTFIFKFQDRNILKLYGVILKQSLRHLICSRKDEIWMGNADLSVKLKRRWMKAKLRSETSGASGDACQPKTWTRPLRTGAWQCLHRTWREVWRRLCVSPDEENKSMCEGHRPSALA